MKQEFYITEHDEPERQRMYRATDGACKVTVEPLKTMTAKQRGSLHRWCEMVAETLNEAGLHCVRKGFWGDEIELDWNMLLVKEHIYKYVLDALTGKKSTEDQDTIEPSAVASHVIRYFSERGVQLPAWPSRR